MSIQQTMFREILLSFPVMSSRGIDGAGGSDYISMKRLPFYFVLRLFNPRPFLMWYLF